MLVQNLHDIGKKKVESVTLPVEAALVYPLLRGRDVHRWHATPSLYILYPHTRDSGWQAIAEPEMKRRFPKGFAYLNQFKEQLLHRAGYSLMRSGHPFYILANTAPEILAPYKVVFKELSTLFQAAVVGEVGGRPVVPDTKLRTIAVRSLEEGHFVSAILNSSAAVLLMYLTAQWVQTPDYQATDIQRLRIPQFDSKNKLHAALAELSLQAHSSAQKNDSIELAKITNQIDQNISAIWKISAAESTMIRKSLEKLVGITELDVFEEAE